MDSVQGGPCPGGLCLGGFCPGVLCPGGLCPGSLCPGGFCTGVLCPGGSLSRGVSVWGVSVREILPYSYVREVRILLECILVLEYFLVKIYFRNKPTLILLYLRPIKIASIIGIFSDFSNIAINSSKLYLLIK